MLRAVTKTNHRGVERMASKREVRVTMVRVREWQHLPGVFVGVHGWSWDRNIHAEEAGDQGEGSHNEGHNSKALHNDIHIHALIAQAKIDH